MPTFQIPVARLGVFICCLLFAAATLAEVAIPSLSQRVTDLTATLNSQQRSALEQRLAEFERQKGSQIAVLMIPTTQPETIEQYSIRVAEAWQLGRQGVDDGVLLLIAKNDRSTRIEVGYGLEGAIPDAMAKRIIDDVMIPYFRQSDFAGGIDAGVDSLIALINGEALPKAKQSASAPPPLGLLFPFLLMLACGKFVFRPLFGPLIGGMVNGGTAATLAFLLGSESFFVIFFLIMGYIVTQDNRRNGYRSSNGYYYGGGYSGGSGSFGGGGGFSGGGGGFGGGGSSGGW